MGLTGSFSPYAFKQVPLDFVYAWDLRLTRLGLSESALLPESEYLLASGT